MTSINQRLAMVEDYRDERRRQYEIGCEAGLGYDYETAEYFKDHPLPTFKQWLIWLRDDRRDAA